RHRRCPMELGHRYRRVNSPPSRQTTLSRFSRSEAPSADPKLKIDRMRLQHVRSADGCTPASVSSIVALWNARAVSFALPRAKARAFELSATTRCDAEGMSSRPVEIALLSRWGLFLLVIVRPRDALGTARRRWTGDGLRVRARLGRLAALPEPVKPGLVGRGGGG